jgi:hypothetical protein
MQQSGGPEPKRCSALLQMPPRRSPSGGSPPSERSAAAESDAARQERVAAQQQHPPQPEQPQPEPEPEPAAAAAALDEAAAAEKKRLKNKAKREKAKAKKLAQAGGPTAEAQKLLDQGDAAAAFALLAPRQNDASPPKLLHRCALTWREACVNAVAAEVTKGGGRGNLQVSPLPDALAFYLRRSGEECVWRLPKAIHPLLAAPLYCRFAFHDGAFEPPDESAPSSSNGDEVRCGEEIVANAKGDMEALQRPNCAGVLVPTGRVPHSAIGGLLADGLKDWAAYWQLRAPAVPRLPQLRRERGGNASLLPSASNQRLATNHLTLPLTILWAVRDKNAFFGAIFLILNMKTPRSFAKIGSGANIRQFFIFWGGPFLQAREHGIDLSPFVGGGKSKGKEQSAEQGASMRGHRPFVVRKSPLF